MVEGQGSSTAPDRLGWRAKFGVIGPSTNTIVQPEFDAMRPTGITNHYSRIYTPDANAISDETFIAGTQVIADNIMHAVDSVMTCAPDHLIMGMSMITFYGGYEGSERFRESIEDRAGVALSLGSQATARALHASGKIAKIGVLSPYFPSANEHVRRFFADCGYTVVRDRALQCPSWTAIAKVTAEQIEALMIDTLDGDDVEALVQVGTNLCMAQQASDLEDRLQKPVIAINTATYWDALRRNDFIDQIEGFGRLLARY